MLKWKFEDSFIGVKKTNSQTKASVNLSSYPVKENGEEEGVAVMAELNWCGVWSCGTGSHMVGKGVL